MRADARRNRERLVAVATEVFARDGATASLDAIARRAGVGSGTLYRHFPDRESLIRAVYRSRVDGACARGRALTDRTDPADALVDWLRVLLGLAVSDGVTAALLDGRQGWPPEFARECHDALAAVGGPLFEQARHVLRPGVTLDDLHALVHGVAGVADVSDEPAARADRLLGLVLDGVRAPEGP